MQQPISRYRGMTYIELLVIVGVITASMTAVLGAKVAADNADNRKQCASHLHQIGLAMILYSNGERNGSFPRTYYDSATVDKPNFYTAADVKNAFGEHGPVNDVTAAMYLLITTQQLTSDVFVCPSTTQEPLKAPEGKQLTDFCNFPNGTSLSYSMNDPYPDMNAISAGYKWNNTLDQHFAVMADRNPGDDGLLKLTADSPLDQQRKGNSANHGQDGQNVLYADGHVEFAITPFCGVDKDNIYTFGDSGKASGGKGIVGAPDGFSDSVCLPTAKDDGPVKQDQE